MTTKTRENERRDYGIIIILILLLGFICIILASGWAIRFAPSWKLNTNMGSNLDPNSDFLTSRPVGFIEPVDSAILTQPAWINIFLTPGISLATRTPLPTSTATLVSVKTSTPISTTQATITSTVAANPTNTLIYIPPVATKTPKPPPPPTNTNTPVTPLIAADLQITKTDGVTTYTPGGTLTYIVTVQNNGTNPVTGAVVTDNKPTQVTTWTWACTLQKNGATGCTGITGSSADFADAVNLPVSASVVYTVTANISTTATGNLTNIANVAVPVGYTDPISGNNTAIDTDTQFIPSADLGITKNDGVTTTTYTPGGSVTYTITVTNAGPNAVTGATVTDLFPSQIASATWSCASAGGATCTASGSGNINDTVNVPVGGVLTYTVVANTAASATGNLINTASVGVPAGYSDPTPGNNSATDTDTSASSSDLSVLSLTDNATDYAANSTKTYTLVVSNAGPSNAAGATVTDVLSPVGNVASITWTCTPAVGAACTASGLGNINDTAVNIPAGSTVTYTITVIVAAAPSGNLVNTATVSLSTDSINGNNSLSDTDQLIVASTFGSPPYLNIGSVKDGNFDVISAPLYVTLQFSTPLIVTVSGHMGYDLVYYEWAQGANPGIWMDAVILQVGDGNNWYTILNWGDGSPDINTNLVVPLASPPNPTTCAGEPDNCEVDASLLYNLTGVAINLDGIVPVGTYPYIRIFSPPAPFDSGDGVEVDAIEILP